MKSCWTVLIILSVLAATEAVAQDAPRDGMIGADDDTRPYVQPTYTFDDPATAVRRKAEFRGRQRQTRVAAMKWYGYSNARPIASPSNSTSATTRHPT